MEIEGQPSLEIMEVYDIVDPNQKKVLTDDTPAENTENENTKKE